MPKLSIIMPVYNVSATVLRSLESIACQGIEDFELIVVDDSSSDDSEVIIENYASEKHISCKLFRQDVNKGVATARNMGLSAAEGEYICFVDADDALEPGALKMALETARQTGADIVGWDWNLCFGKNARYMAQRDYSKAEEALENLFCGVMRWNLWLFLYRRQMIEENHIAFLDGMNMGEDMQFTLRAFYSSSNVAQIHKALYNYNAVNGASVSKQFNEKRRIEVSANIEEVSGFFNGRLKDNRWLDFLKLNIKLPLLVSGSKEDYLVWRRWMPEANPFSLKNKLLPLRSRLLQWCAFKGMWPIVYIYYILVYRFIYGVLFR